MNLKKYPKIPELIWIIIGVFITCSLISVFRVLQEIVEPSYSGLGRWYPLIQLPVIIIIPSVIAIIIQSIAQLAHWSKLTFKRHLLLIGVICALSANTTILMVCLVLIVALWVRYEFSSLQK